MKKTQSILNSLNDFAVHLEPRMNQVFGKNNLSLSKSPTVYLSVCVFHVSLSWLTHKNEKERLKGSYTSKSPKYSMAHNDATCFYFLRGLEYVCIMIDWFIDWFINHWIVCYFHILVSWERNVSHFWWWWIRPFMMMIRTYFLLWFDL